MTWVACAHCHTWFQLQEESALYAIQEHVKTHEDAQSGPILTWDEPSGVGYLYLQGNRAVRTYTVASDLMADVDEHDRVVGVEFLGTPRQSVSGQAVIVGQGSRSEQKSA